MSASDHHQGAKKSGKHKRVKKRPVLEQVPQQQQDGAGGQSADGNSKFARALASTDYATREQGLQALSRWLLAKQSLPELDVMRLWKGLFFCFWHSDKVPVQTELAVRLAGLLPQMQAPMARLYWAGLLATLRREWSAMDHHRLNKFLMLVRKFVAALFTRLEATRWEAGAITALTADLPLGQEVVPAGDSRSLGLSYHLADVWLQELRDVAASRAVPPASLLLLLEPFTRVLEASREQPLIDRVKDSVFDVLVQDLTAASAGASGDDGDASSWRYCSKLDPQQLAELLFDRGAAEGVRARNREALYSTSKGLERVAGKRRKLAAGAGAGGAVGVGAAQPAEQLEARAAAAKEAKKKKKKAARVAEAEEQQQQQIELDGQQQQSPLLQQQQAQGDAAATPGKKKRKQHQDQQQQPAEPAAFVVAATMPGSSQKQLRAHTQQQQQQQAAAAASASPDKATPNKKKKKRHSAGGDAAAAAASTPAAPAAAAAARTPAAASAAKANGAAGPGTGGSSSKKGVIIDLNRNVYFAHGAPVPALDIRTPPRAKPKGPALKAQAAGGPAGQRGAAASVPVKRSASRLLATPPVGGAGGGVGGGAGAAAGGRRVATPNSVPRVKAAAFF